MKIKLLGNKSKIIRNVYKGKFSGAHYLEMIRNSKQFTNKSNGTRTQRSIRRTINNIKEILMCNLDEKSYFFTLTYADNLNDYKNSMYNFKNWIKIIKTKYNIDLKYIAIKELQQRGAIHYHCIIFDIDNNKLAFNLIKEWKHGRRFIKKITKLYPWSIANYFGNYFNDNNQLIISNKKIFTKSTNLKKPIIIDKLLIDYAMQKEPNTPIETFDYLNIDIYDLAVYMFGVDKVILI